MRSTDDVDLIVHVMGPVGFARLQETLREHGFRVSAEEGDENFPICAMKLGDLRVDFMPDDDSLGFSNRWYKDAMATSTAYDLDQETTINLVSPSTSLPPNWRLGKAEAGGMPWPVATSRTSST